MFPTVIVPEIAADQVEPLGTKFKFWFIHDDSFKYLYKEGREGTGENWAEKVASELCDLLGIPHAVYELATWKGRNGVVTKSFVPKEGRLIHGNELLAKIVKGYAQNEQSQLYKQKQYSLRPVAAILSLKQLRLPIGSSEFMGIETALDIFTGYLMLDAWIANQDRHHENWGLVLTGDRSLHLSPTYDHASSMGRNETDDSRRNRLSSRDKRGDMNAYVRRAQSAFYEAENTEKRMSTIDAFLYMARKSQAVAEIWLERLGDISPGQIQLIFGQIPKTIITETAIQFAQEILCLNRERLLSYRGNLT